MVCLEYVRDRLVTGSFDQSIRVWDIKSGTTFHVLKGHTDWVYALRYDGNAIVSGSWDATVKIWQFEEEPPLLRRRNTIAELPFSPPHIVGGE